MEDSQEESIFCRQTALLAWVGNTPSVGENEEERKPAPQGNQQPNPKQTWKLPWTLKITMNIENYEYWKLPWILKITMNIENYHNDVTSN